MEDHDNSNWQVVSRTGKATQRGGRQGRIQQQAQPLLIDIESDSSPQVMQPGLHSPPPNQRQSRGISPKRWMKSDPRGNKGTKRRPPPNFHTESDNQALESWRKHEPPKQTVRVPDELILQEDSLKSLQKLAHERGSFLFSEHLKAAGGTVTFGIWGDDGAAIATRNAIGEIITEWRGPKKSHRSAAFAKIVSLTPNGRIRAQKEWKREVTRQRFRQYPPPDKPFGAIGTFYWPLQDYRPEEVLGMNYEALDAIRMDCASYVVFVPERSAFQIMGAADNVQAGLLRLRKTCFQIAARQIAPVRMYLLAWLEASRSPSHVVLQPYDGPRLISGGDSNNTSYSSPRAEGVGTVGEWQLQQQSAENEARVRNIFLKTLPNLHYYRGHINLRIRMGKFCATQFRKASDDKYDLGDYETMIRESQFTGRVTDEIGDWATECTALRKLQNADELLVPHDALTHTLEAVKPIYNVLLTFADEHGDLRLAMSWVEVKDETSESTTFEAVSKKWTRLERDTGTTSSIIDISLKDLHSGLAWHFDMQASQAVEESRVPDKLVEFADSIRIDEKQARLAKLDKSFVILKPNTCSLKGIQQRISYRYGIKGSDYTVELTNYQNRALSPRKSLILPPEQGSLVYEPRWSLDVYRMDWDRLFTLNERLPIGERADWEHDADTWFPQDITEDQVLGGSSVGFAQLMEKLHMLARLLTGEDDDLLMDTGMTVG